MSETKHARPRFRYKARTAHQPDCSDFKAAGVIFKEEWCKHSPECGDMEWYPMVQTVSSSGEWVCTGYLCKYTDPPSEDSDTMD